MTFRHPLVRSAVYRAASPAERRAVHQALAGATDPRADPDRRAWHRAQAAPGPDEDVAAELERSASRAQARGGLAAAAAFLERSAALTLDPARRAGRALAAAQATYQAGAFDTTLRLLGTAEAGPLDELQRARADLLRGQIAFSSSRGSDAPPLLLKAAREFEPVDPRLARETYLDALAAAISAGRLALGGGMREVAEAARAAPPPGPPRGPDLLLDGLALLVTEGYPAGAPVLRQAVSAFRGPDVSAEEGLRWLWLASRAAWMVWDYPSWDVLSDRQVTLARDAGALFALPLAFNMRAGVHVFAGEFTEAASMVAQAESVIEVTGSSLAPYGALALAVFRGQEAQAAQLIQTATDDVGRRGEGRALSLMDWADAVLCNSLGRYEEALAAAQRASEDSLAVQFTGWALVELIEAAVRSGVPERAAGALQRLCGIARACGTDWALGAEARSRALVSDGEAAEHLYREAIDRFGRTRLRVDLARARLVYGEWLRRQRRRRDARDQLGHRVRDLRLGRRRGVRRTGAHRAAGQRRAGPRTRRPGARCPDRAGSADRPPGRRRRLQRRDRRAAVHQPRHRRLPPAEGLHQARRQLPQPACSRAFRPPRRSTTGHATALIPRPICTAAAVPGTRWAVGCATTPGRPWLPLHAAAAAA